MFYKENVETMISFLDPIREKCHINERYYGTTLFYFFTFRGYHEVR